MSNVIRDQIQALRKEAVELACRTLASPKTEREYMQNVGKYQQLLATAGALEDKFFAPEPTDPEMDLEEEEPPPRRQTRQDRLDAVRRRHVPRQA